MREEQRRSEDCLPIWRQLLLPANELVLQVKDLEVGGGPGTAFRSRQKPESPWCLSVKKRRGRAPLQGRNYVGSILKGGACSMFKVHVLGGSQDTK